MNEACIPDTPQYVVAALYQFVELVDFADLKPVLERLCQQHEVVGTLLLAREGINGTVCGPRAGIVALLRHLWADPRFAPLQPKYSVSPTPAFIRMKVKLKQEIVTMGKQSIDPKRLVGRYVPPQDWNALIADPGTLVVDTRNHYEYAIGTFAGAVDPYTSTFREFPTWVENTLSTLPQEQRPKRIAMFCTGGIRCEKATAYMLEQGFEEVYHLQGGILKYLEEVPPEQSLWQGQCFVFDQRVAVGHGLEIADYTMCHGCRMPLSEEDRASEFYEEGVHCPHCYPKLSDEQKLRFAERQKQVQLAKARGERHVGPKGRV